MRAVFVSPRHLTNTRLFVKGIVVSRTHYYLAGCILSSAILNIFIEDETAGIKIICTILLFSTFGFDFLFHSLKNSVEEFKSKPEE
jgi:hypothetical protein